MRGLTSHGYEVHNKIKLINKKHTVTGLTNLKLSKHISFDNLSAGLKLEIVSSLAQRSSMGQLRRLFESRAIFKLPVIVKRATQIVHSTFLVLKLKKCLSDETLVIPLDRIQVADKLYFIEKPVEIIDCEVKRLKQIRILIVKVCWNSRRGPEFTWEN
nr:putative reverse transcriptase domain-containing protein [Tanacetum cinerariifolium]